MLSADGYLLGTPANLGYMSGALKHFFDQIYYPCLDATVGRPYALYVHGNSDTAGAVRAVESLVTGLRWNVWRSAVLDCVPACSVSCAWLAGISAIMKGLTSPAGASSAIMADSSSSRRGPLRKDLSGQASISRFSCNECTCMLGFETAQDRLGQSQNTKRTNHYC